MTPLVRQISDITMWNPRRQDLVDFHIIQFLTEYGFRVYVNDFKADKDEMKI